MSEEEMIPEKIWFPKTNSVDVLGTTYTITAVAETLNNDLSECAGYTDAFSKEIVVDDYSKFKELYPKSKLTKDVSSRIRSTVRHEIVHAFMIESGITNSSTEIKWAHDESLIEWLSTMIPKMVTAMEQAGALKSDTANLW